jgi:hypothetical protein
MKKTSTSSTKPKRKPTRSFKEVFTEINKYSHQLLLSKYKTDNRSYNIKTINEIIYNEKSHVVAAFKDYLIYDDTSEFLKRFYAFPEASNRLPKIYDFYDSYSKIFANYIILPESKYMYKNIQRKQKMIDNLQNLNAGNGDDPQNSNNLTNNIFNTEIYNSLMNLTYTINNESKRSILLKENSFVSIEGLINSIGKAEKEEIVKLNNININVDNSQQPRSVQQFVTMSKNGERKKGDFAKLVGNNVNSYLVNNIRPQEKKVTPGKTKVTTDISQLNKALSSTKSPNTASKQSIATGSKLYPMASLNIINSLSNTSINNLAFKPTSRDKTTSSTSNTKRTTTATSTATNAPLYNKKPYVVQKSKQTFISHKGANSMPKLNNEIYNNFNIINNNVSNVVSPSTQINIYNNLNDGGIISSQINIVEEAQHIRDKDTIETSQPKLKKIITISNIAKRNPLPSKVNTNVTSNYINNNNNNTINKDTTVIKPYNSNDIKIFKKKSIKSPIETKNFKSTFCGNSTNPIITNRELNHTSHTNLLQNKPMVINPCNISNIKSKQINTSKLDLKEKTLREIIHRDLFEGESERSKTKSKVNFL